MRKRSRRRRRRNNPPELLCERETTRAHTHETSLPATRLGAFVSKPSPLDTPPQTFRSHQTTETHHYIITITITIIIIIIIIIIISLDSTILYYML